jgi:hypothetical protein
VARLDALLSLSEEYDMLKCRKTLENHLIGEVNACSAVKKFYGDRLTTHVAWLMRLVELSEVYRLARLKSAVIEHMVGKVDRCWLEKNEYYANGALCKDTKLEIVTGKLQMAEARVACDEKTIRLLKDDLLKQKFEIQRLNNLTKNNSL